jgi:hypothetical protein
LQDSKHAKTPKVVTGTEVVTELVSVKVIANNQLSAL